MRYILTFILLITAPAHAQIYADFSVTRGGISLGTFTVTLEHGKAPRTCANFIGLATGKRPWIDVKTGAVRVGKPFYNGLKFHRLIHNFVIQGGSPNGLGTDGPGYSILDEYEPTLRHAKYVISMAKGGFPNTGGSQFFITLRATPELDDKHSVFGVVTAGTGIIDGFTNPADFPTDANNKPLTDIVIESVAIYGPEAASFDIEAPARRLPTVSNVPFTVERDPVARTFGMRFRRSAKADHLLLVSTDLQTWFQPQHFLSVDSEEDFRFVYSGVDLPRAFFSLATVSYEQVPLAPQSLTKIRIHQTDTFYLDLVLNGTTGTWSGSDGSSGTLTNVVYQSDAPATPFIQLANLEADRFPLGNLSLTFSSVVGPELWSGLNTFLSFHSESSGWTEEKQGSPRRKRFEILSN